MGLDVYLEKCDDFEKMNEAEETAGELTNAVWDAYGKYENITEEQKVCARNRCEEIEASLGVPGGQYPHQKIEIDSAKYPEHLFKIGYFRSSYNDGGIDSIMHLHKLPTLGEIMGYQDRYKFKPDWDACKARCLDAIQRFDSSEMHYGVVEADHNRLTNHHLSITSGDKALEIFLKEKAIVHDGYSAYSNINGNFFLNGIKCFGFIPGVGTLRGPAVYVIIENTEITWYRQALEIVLETIDYVLSQPDKDKHYLVWSG